MYPKKVSSKDFSYCFPTGTIKNNMCTVHAARGLGADGIASIASSASTVSVSTRFSAPSLLQVIRLAHPQIDPRLRSINVHPAFAHQRSTNRPGVALASVTARGGDGNDAERSKYVRSTDENSEESGSKAVALSDEGPADPA